VIHTAARLPQYRRDVRERAYAACYARADQRRPTASESAEYRLHAAETRTVAPDDVRPFRLRMLHGADGVVVIGGPEHGFDGSITLCGIPDSEIDIVRHLWKPDGRDACPRCIGQQSALSANEIGAADS
jgi:hypothetical protein